MLASGSESPPGPVPVRPPHAEAVEALLDGLSVDPSKGLLVSGAKGHYLNAWTGNNYGSAHATSLEPMSAPLLGYAYGETGLTSYLTLSTELIANSEAQSTDTPYLQSYTQWTRFMPAYLWYLQTPEAKAEGAGSQIAPAAPMAPIAKH